MKRLDNLLCGVGAYTGEKIMTIDLYCSLSSRASERDGEREREGREEKREIEQERIQLVSQTYIIYKHWTITVGYVWLFIYQYFWKSDTI